MINFAASFARDGHTDLLRHFIRSAGSTPELMAVLTMATGRPNMILSGLNSPDSVLRRAAALNVAAGRSQLKNAIGRIHTMAKSETDRDTLAAYLLAAHVFSGNATADGLLKDMSKDKDHFIASLARRLSAQTANEKCSPQNVFNKKEQPSCHP